jgi:hypothetical protein
MVINEPIAQAAVHEPSKRPASLSIRRRSAWTCRSITATPKPGRARIGFAFKPRTWDGETVNAEPDKHSWATPVRLPPDTVGYTAAVITAVERGTRFTLNGW